MLDLSLDLVDLVLVLPDHLVDLDRGLAHLQLVGLQQLLLVLHQSDDDGSLLVARC